MAAAPTPVHRRRAPHRHDVALLVAVVLLAAAVAVLLLRHDVIPASSGTGGTRGSGVAATETRAVPPFSSVELAGSSIVTIAVGRPRSVVVHADDNLVGHVTTEVASGELVIGNTSGSFTTETPMRVVVSAPSLEAVTLSGSGIVTVEDVEAGSFTVSLPGSGVVRASGGTGRLDVDLAGSGDAQLATLIARDVHVAVGGSGRVDVTATRSLDATVSGSGAILYGGDPARVTRNVTGSGAVVPR
jgi:hypothetical protein